MIINWLGLSCFKIQTKEAVLIIDPYQDQCGLKMPKLKADVILISDQQNRLANNSERIAGAPLVIADPGEFEVRQIFISSLSAGQSDQAASAVFYLELEDLTIGHLGNINHSLSNEQLETIEGVDILLLPISSLSPERRSKIISQVEPRIIIPMSYKIPGCKEKLEDVEKFLKEMGVKQKQIVDKLKIAKKDLPDQETKIILLKPEC